ncbi:hypothetical protein UO65_3699 [Actinokineospora spheciospongiae]|uniref:Uncharacterized protein n=1 Tax=Actinokineospora spheciospongiae TaxID=909613 RepID=W7IWY2_9PSEU|nr:hypothetical protein [Actinokineospora spheciospongiae]EWC60966.1 hypothetical protein UO65_3699 [Actinokineospora spheciospongiae]
MAVDVVVQWVRTWWTKESRSGVAAARRNALPTVFLGVPTRHVDERVQLTVYRRSASR